MDSVESGYLRRIDVLTARERIERAASMFQWARETIARQIMAESGSVGPERLKWLVAMRQYGSDNTMQKLIQRALENVSD